MEPIDYIAAALCALSLLAALPAIHWLSAPSTHSLAYERKLRNFKLFRTTLLACIALSQGGLSVAKLVEQHGSPSSIAIGNGAVAASWTLSVVRPDRAPGRERAMSARPAPALGAHRMRCRVLAPAGVGRPGGRRQRPNW